MTRCASLSVRCEPPWTDRGSARRNPASEGAERDRTWPATVPTRDGTVLEVTDERLIVQMNADTERPLRRQTYALRGKSVYVAPGDTFRAYSTILAGEPPALADLSAYLPRRYAPARRSHSDIDVDRYAAAKALRFRDDPRRQVISALECLIRRESEHRVALEAAGFRRRARLRIRQGTDHPFRLGQR